ncbi:MAG TPA: prolyl oligopeptidase family serine peptidase [Mycobacterium sp.]|nr:prolyl oligopeptidase family serine peptidase [Mycobacterium sp.]
MSTFYRTTEPWTRRAVTLATRELTDRTFMGVHGATDTNVPVSESEQMVDALRTLCRSVRYLLRAHPMFRELADG